jgi:hypothetical protein
MGLNVNFRSDGDTGFGVGMGGFGDLGGSGAVDSNRGNGNGGDEKFVF